MRSRYGRAYSINRVASDALQRYGKYKALMSLDDQFENKLLTFLRHCNNIASDARYSDECQRRAKSMAQAIEAYMEYCIETVRRHCSDTTDYPFYRPDDEVVND